jgi:hypothetical protein
VELLASAGFLVGLPFNHDVEDVSLKCGAASELHSVKTQKITLYIVTHEKPKYNIN